MKITIYKKETHTDQYLNLASNHYLNHKRSVVRILMDRADRLVTEEGDKQEEKGHIRKVLGVNGYRPWMFNVTRKKKKEGNQLERTRKKQTPIALPYVKGVSEQLERVFRK